MEVINLRRKFKINNLSYRAFHKEHKTMHEVFGWKYGGLILIEEHDAKYWEKISTYIIMQSTGIKDRNEIEIFEDNIFKWGAYRKTILR